MEELVSLEEWNNVSAKPLDLTQMDNLVKQYQEARAIYDAAKEEATSRYKIVDELEAQIVNALKSANKKTYIAEGIGRATIKHKYVVPTPKTSQNKWSVLRYIENKYGQDVRDSYISINHQSLNSFYNQEKENSQQPGFTIPGLDLPTLQESLSFTKAK